MKMYAVRNKETGDIHVGLGHGIWIPTKEHQESLLKLMQDSKMGEFELIAVTPEDTAKRSENTQKFEVENRLKEQIEKAKARKEYDFLRKLIYILDGIVIITEDNEEDFGYYK